jgi:hypothetical protein
MAQGVASVLSDENGNIVTANGTLFQSYWNDCLLVASLT